ncbi:MAG: amidohydrolase [Thermomicrobiales bacterium]|nr:amidohydrolase [Thermomicrobiales bacterium]MCO5219017.1 amidohydrolase [Thermomicrobiales bacterium]
MTLPTLPPDVDEIVPGVVADRRYLHENPELGFDEHVTSKFVVERLEALGAEDIQSGIAGTGVTALIHGTRGEGKCVLLRADMDALPILEETPVEFASQNPGVMHACGHDGHTAMLLGVARILTERRDQFPGSVKLCFQPSEEANAGGAKPMIEAGVLENPHVDACFGQHVMSDRPTGEVWVGGGPIQASADMFTITVQGKGGHGAIPHTAIDSIMVASDIVSGLHKIVSRNIDPLDPVVISVCSFHSGTAFNVIPDTAELKGTVRTFSPENRDLAEKRLKEVAEGVAAAQGATVTIDYDRGYPPTINDDAMSALAAASIAKIVGEDNVKPMVPIMPAEDMSYFLEERPGCYFMTGCGNEEKGIVWPHHHPRFDLDEDVLGIGVAALAQVAIDYLNAES